MKYKLIAFDLDGTLLDGRKQVSPENLRALEAAAESGAVVAAATGRIIGGIPEEIRSLPFLRYYISVNGAYVYDTLEDRVLYRGEIPVKMALALCRYMDALSVLYDCYQDNRGWMSGDMYGRIDEFFGEERYVLDLVRRLRTPVPNLAETLEVRGRPVQKMQMYFLPEQMSERTRQLETLAGRFPGLAVTTSFWNNIEINSLDADKGLALKALCGRLGLDMGQTMAFGDGSNDINMLRAAGLGVAMANAAEAVKAAADMETGDNEHSGVAQMIWRALAGEV